MWTTQPPTTPGFYSFIGKRVNSKQEPSEMIVKVVLKQDQLIYYLDGSHFYPRNYIGQYHRIKMPKPPKQKEEIF